LIQEIYGRDHANKVLYKCLCDCGNTVIVRKNNIARKTKSCGCLRKETTIKRCQKPIKEVFSNKKFNDYRKFDSRRGVVEFSLSREQVKLLIYGKCYYCDTLPRREVKYRGRYIKYNGIDRVDNNKGYTPDNCVSCCTICNYMKRTMSYTDFVNHIKNIHVNLKIKKIFKGER